VPKERNLALEAPRLGMRGLLERSASKIKGFCRDAQIGKSGPGGAKPWNERFAKERCY